MVSNPNHPSSVVLGTGPHLNFNGALQANTVRLHDLVFTIFIVTLEILPGHVMEQGIYCTNMEQLRIFKRGKVQLELTTLVSVLSTLLETSGM